MPGVICRQLHFEVSCWFRTAVHYTVKLDGIPVVSQLNLYITAVFWLL